MSTISLKRNDVILARNSRNEKWKTVVFQTFDTSWSNQIKCVDGLDNQWNEWTSLQWHENLQDTSLPADGWKKGDMCCYRDLDGLKKLGFYYGTTDEGAIEICTIPPSLMETDEERKHVFQIPEADISRPETEWPWWSPSFYKEAPDPNPFQSRIVPCAATSFSCSMKEDFFE